MSKGEKREREREEEAEWWQYMKFSDAFDTLEIQQKNNSMLKRQSQRYSKNVTSNNNSFKNISRTTVDKEVKQLLQT